MTSHKPIPKAIPLTISTVVDALDGATNAKISAKYGHAEVVAFLIERGMDVNTPLRPHQQTGLHWAAFGGHSQIVERLLRTGAHVDVTDGTFGTTPLMWALYAWGEEPAAPSERYHEVVTALVAAGSVVKSEWLQDEKVRADAKMVAALTSK